MTGLVAALLCAAAPGCSAGPPPDGDMCSLQTLRFHRTLELRGLLDVLFVVDSSPSMAEERERLAEQLPALARMLTTGHRLDPDTGEVIRRFPPPGPLHLGVVTTDLGCEPLEGGDDGVLRSPSGDGEPGFVRWWPGDPVDPDLSRFERGADVGTTGCGFEQPLEAALKALAPAAAEPEGAFDGTFLYGRGHRDGANRDFRRSEAFLGVVVVTDEDDCSVGHPDAVEAPATVWATEGDPGCRDRTELLQPVERYVDGLAAVAGGFDALGLSIVAGVPPDLLGDVRMPDYDAMLDDPRMRPGVREDRPDRLQASCGSDGAMAFPPRRLLEAARGLQRGGALTGVQSICERDFGRALAPVIDFLRSTESGCLLRVPPPKEDGTVGCRIVETLPAEGDVTECASLRELGREPFVPPRRAPSGNEVCRIVQRRPGADGRPPAEPGWYYDDASRFSQTFCGDVGGMIRYTEGAWPVGVIELQCTYVHPVSEPEGSGPPQCVRTHAGGAGVTGRSCLPRRDPPESDMHLAYVETGHPDCNGGACVAYELWGDPHNLESEGCPLGERNCVTTQQVARHVTCSCRCNGTAGTGPFCACPEGTRCTRVVVGDPDHAASYCVSVEALCCSGEVSPDERDEVCSDVSC